MGIIVLGTDGHNLKSVPLNSLPPEAWKSLTGGGDTSDVITLYEAVPWLYRAVEHRAAVLASMPITWTVGGKESEDSPTLPFDFDAYALINGIEAHLVLYGRAYLFKGRNAFDRTRVVRLLHPTTIHEKYNEETGAITFERTVGGRTTPFGERDIVRIALPTRKTELGWGQAPAAVALHAAGVLQAGNALQKALFEQGVINPTIITVDGMPPSQELEKLENWVERSFAGIRNAFRTIALRAGIKVQPLSTVDLKTMSMPELTQQQREDIAVSLGVPQSIIFSDAANYATAQQDDLNLYDKTVIPQARLIERGLNGGLFEALGVEMKLDETRLELYEKLTTQANVEFAEKMGGRFFTADEVRERFGAEPLTSAQRAELMRDAQDLHAPAQNTAEEPPLPDDEDDPVGDERKALATWRKMARRRYGEGKATKALDFAHGDVSEFVRAFVVAGLRGAEDWTKADAVFSAAAEWAGYP